MATAKFDDGLPSNPKFIAAGASACWLWFCGVLYCRRGLTDGLIPRVVVPTLVIGLSSPYKHAARLVEVTLWDAEGRDYRVHDFLDWNPSKAQVEGYRAHDRDRKQSRHQSALEASGNPSGIQADASRIPFTRATHAGGKSASVSVSGSEALSEGEKSAREGGIEPVWRLPSEASRGAGLVDGPAQRRHQQNHVVCFHARGLCVTPWVHEELIGRKGGPKAAADAWLRDFYSAEILALGDAPVPDKPDEFWRRRFMARLGGSPRHLAATGTDVNPSKYAGITQGDDDV